MGLVKINNSVHIWKDGSNEILRSRFGLMRIKKQKKEGNKHWKKRDS